MPFKLFKITLLFSAVILSACISDMYPDYPINKLETVENGESFELANDITFANAKRGNSTILYAGKYTHFMSSDNGKFFANETYKIGLNPKFGDPEKFNGGIFIPEDKIQPCLTFWYVPNLPGTGGIIGNIMVGNVGDIRLYTWVPDNLENLPNCGINRNKS